MSSPLEREWMARHLGRTATAVDALPDVSRLRLAFSGHLEAKMEPMFRRLVERGARICLTTCNPVTVRGDFLRDMAELGIEVLARPNMSAEEQAKSFRDALAWQPTLVMEMGADLTLAAAEVESSTIRASLECTGSGLKRLAALKRLPHPVFDGDSIPLKRGLHNRRMVGVMTWHVFIEKTRLSLHERRVLVLGFGPVGRGLAEMARAHGGDVVVVDSDPGRTLEAGYAGFATASLQQALPDADVVVTATGVHKVLAAHHFALLKEGCFLLNSGHENTEIDVEALLAHRHREVLPHVTEIELPGRRVYLLANGAMINLAAGFGDTINAFDVTLATLVIALGYIMRSDLTPIEPRLHELPAHLWAAIQT